MAEQPQKPPNPADDDTPYPIEGVPLSDDVKFMTDEQHKIPYAPGIPLRREISELADTDPEKPQYRQQWTLFVLALEKFKAVPVEKKLSYFRIAGIHSYPLITWDEGKPKPLDHEGKGYCPHNTLLFPSWHRVYMVLYEQILYENMLDVIDNDFKLTGDEAEHWKKQAREWRLPYWDWARKQKYAESFAVPEVLTVNNVNIFPPESAGDKYGKITEVDGIGRTTAYPNPLYGFENPEVDRQGNPRQFGYMPPGKRLFSLDNSYGSGDVKTDHPANDNCNPWSLTTSTGRWGIQITPTKRYSGLDGVNNFGMANSTMATMDNNPDPDLQWYQYNPGNFSDAVNRLLSRKYNYTWGAFATTKWYNEEADARAFMSLEYIHNNVHNVAGGGDFKYGIGHMSDVPVAAFDPIFWLHHCQIDRLFAMFQALNWDEWWDQAEKDPERPEKKEKMLPDKLPTDPLTPFHKRTEDGVNKSYWDSNDSRDWTKLRYQYDDLVPQPDAIGEDGYLNEDRYKLDLEAYINKIYPGTSQAIGTIRHDDSIKVPAGLSRHGGDVFDDYVINIVYDRFALGGQSYSIQFFLGGPEDVKKTNFVRANLIGEIYTFTGPAPDESGIGGCQNCKEQKAQHMLSSAQIPMTISLVNHIFSRGKDYPIKDFNDIEGYLEYHLSWQFREHGGKLRNPADFPLTQITVCRGTGKPLHTPIQSNAEVKTEAIVAAVAEAVAAADQAAGEVKVEQRNLPPVAAIPPAYQDYEPVYKATHGKPWGAKDPAVRGTDTEAPVEA